MNPVLLIVLIGVDLLLIGLVLLALRRTRPETPNLEILREVDHERRLLKEMRDSVREELGQKHADMKLLYEKVATIATETEMDLQSSSQSLARDMDEVLQSARASLNEDLADLDKRRTSLSSLLKRSKEERLLLHKAIGRGEKLTQFFDGRIPYQEVLDEIGDKKYVDARHLLAKGLAPAQVARELSMPESEVRLLASMG